MEFLHSFPSNVENSDGGPKSWLFSQATTSTPFDFHIFIHYLQVDTEEEDNGTNKTQAQCSVTYFVIILLFILIIAINCPDWLSPVLI